MEPPAERIDYVAHDVSMLQDDVCDLRERLEKAEYMLRRLSLKFPDDLSKTDCAGCKYIMYGRSYGDGKSGELELVCGNKPYWWSEYRPIGNGCYKWERRK